jgi:catechol 2,3-dioxygenase-like lactoylglutathione lyase family enzyme
VNLTGIDHFVLAVSDLEAACEFYADLGAEVVTFGDDRRALQFGDQKINLHGPDTDAGLVADLPQVGTGDFCLVTDASADRVVATVRDLGVEILEGPVERTGARGSMTSVYFRDPDGNLVEIATYDE